jgi:TetR/AcrR family transcriptional repressor of mexJK operon
VTESALKQNASEADTRPARGRPRDTEKNSAILEAASQAFLESGFDGTSMDEVARRAGVSKQTVYSHFSSKEQLFSAAIREKIEVSFPEPAIGDGARQTPEAELRVFVERFCRLLMSAEAIAMHRVLVAAAGKGPELAKIFWESGPAEMIDRLGNFLRTWADAGELEIDDYHLAGKRLVALIKGQMHFELSIGLRDSFTEEEFQRHVGNVVDAFLRIYRAN